MKSKENYQLILEKELEKIKALQYKPTLLLHACCAPCSSYVLEYLSSYFDITVDFYNPNIDSKEEYLLRGNELKRLCEEMRGVSANVRISEFEHLEFLNAVKGLENEAEGGKRCIVCFRLRLAHAAKLALDEGFDYFTTTLSVSPLKDSQLLNRLGKQFSETYSVPYLYSDFKKKDGYKRSIELSKVFSLYRQNYCGCEFSREPKQLN